MRSSHMSLNMLSYKKSTLINIFNLEFRDKRKLSHKNLTLYFLVAFQRNTFHYLLISAIIKVQIRNNKP